MSTKEQHETELSDNWERVFNLMEKGETVEVSERIYYDMLGSVPPIQYTGNSFYVGEPYNGNWHHFFEKIEGKYYGRLKQLTNSLHRV